MIRLTEGQFLKGTVVGLGEDEISEDNLEGQPGDVDKEVAPANVLKTIGLTKVEKKPAERPKSWNQLMPLVRT